MRSSCHPGSRELGAQPGLLQSKQATVRYTGKTTLRLVSGLQPKLGPPPLPMHPKYSEIIGETEKSTKKLVLIKDQLKQRRVFYSFILHSNILRVNIEDLIKIKAKAKRNGIAYQTLISLLIRQYIKGETEVIL